MRPKRAIIPVFVPHLGCPNMCVFCNQRRISGSPIPADAAKVRCDIISGLSKISDGIDVSVAFYGGSFTAIPAEQQEELLQAAQPFLQSGAVTSLRISTRPDAINGEIVERLLRYGVKTVELGVQSMCDDVLRASKRGHTPEDARCAAKLLKDSGFELVLQMMTGLPGDTPEKSEYTAREFISMKPDGVRIYPTVIIKETELYDLWTQGRYKEHTLEDAIELCSKLMELFEDADIPVIRLGLNPTDELSGGDAVAGAYHPALGELVMNRRYLKRELALVTEADRGQQVTFGIAPGRVSAAVGQRKCNVRTIESRYGISRVTFREVEDVHGMDVVRVKS